MGRGSWVSSFFLGRSGCVGSGVGAFLSLYTNTTFYVLTSYDRKPAGRVPCGRNVGMVPAPMDLIRGRNDFGLDGGATFSTSAPRTGAITRCFTTRVGLTANCRVAIDSGTTSGNVTLTVSRTLSMGSRNCALSIAPRNIAIGTGAPRNLFCNVRAFVRLLPTRVRDPTIMGNVT